MSKNKSSERRKRYFIRKGFQIAFILKFCSLLLMGVIISTGLLFLFSRDTLTSSFQQSELVIKNTAIAILPTAVYTNLVTLGLIAIATIIVLLFISHKLAGPLFRFDKEIKEIGEGNLTTVVTLRNKDQITDLAATLNHMTGSLRDKVLSIQKEVAHSIETASQENASERLMQELNYLHKRIGEHFKI
jgi:methyl-accepting chemotaxis protein